MSNYSTKWTGSYPCLCSGEWELYKNGKLLNVDIPFQNSFADTFGEYSTWSFDEDYSEEWSSFEDGLDCKAWIKENENWLSSFAPEKDWEEIYHAFQENDWRYGCCGGCI